MKAEKKRLAHIAQRKAVRKSVADEFGLSVGDFEWRRGRLFQVMPTGSLLQVNDVPRIPKPGPPPPEPTPARHTLKPEFTSYAYRFH